MASNRVTNGSKKDEYLLKFKQYREEKEKQKKEKSREDTLKSQNTVPKGAPQSIKKTSNGTKLAVQTSTISLQSKENKNPSSKSGIKDKLHTSTKAPVSRNFTQNSTSHTKSAVLINKQKHVEQKTSGINKSTASEKRLSNPAVVRRKSVSTSQDKFITKDRKSNGTFVPSRYHNVHKKTNVSNNNLQKNKPVVSENKKTNVLPKARRHSDTLKEEKRKKPTSILKRKSCFASIDFEAVRETVGKTPDHVRSVRFISPDTHDENASVNTYRKTPKRSTEQSNRQPTPKCLGKKRRHEEQIDIRNKLDEWLKSKGRTPSKFRHLMCFHDKDQEDEVESDSCIKRSLTVEELTEQKAAIDREEGNVKINLAGQFRDAALDELDSMLEECTTLYEAGCPREDILRWLDSIEENIKLTKTYAKFYICKAQVLKSAENLEKVLEVYETAVVSGAQPSIDLATALTGIVKELCHEREKKARRRSAAEVQQENIFESSAIKYTVRKVTPFSKKRRKSANDAQLSPCAVVTPVRRSTRRSISCLPHSLQDKTPTYKSLEDMSDQEKKRTLFFPNDALCDDHL